MEWLLSISLVMLVGMGIIFFVENTVFWKSNQKIRQKPKSIQFSLSDE